MRGEQLNDIDRSRGVGVSFGCVAELAIRCVIAARQNRVGDSQCACEQPGPTLGCHWVTSS